MVLTIHRPHLPHAGAWTRPRTMLLSGLVAVGIAAGAVIAVQQFDGSTSAPATTDTLGSDRHLTTLGELGPMSAEVPAVGADAIAEALSQESLAGEVEAIHGGR